MHSLHWDSKLSLLFRLILPVEDVILCTTDRNALATLLFQQLG